MQPLPSSFHMLHRHTLWIFCLVFSFIQSGSAQEKADSSVLMHLTERGVMSPSDWLQQTENTLMNIESKLIGGQDTAFMKEEFERLEKDFLLARNDYELHGQFMRIRSLEDLIAKLNQQRDKAVVWRNRIFKINGEVTAQFFLLEKIKNDSIQQLMKADTALWNIYGNEVRNISGWVEKIDTQYYAALRKFVLIEHRVSTLSFQIIELLRTAEYQLKIRGNDLFFKSHPAIWELTNTFYKENIGSVMRSTLHQNIDSLKFYGKNAYIRAILFRLFILLITMLPVYYFRRLKKEEGFAGSNLKYTLVHKYTGAATASFGMVMAPFIFINAPHIFIETILATLAITTSIIFVKENPVINRRFVYTILIAYIILHFFNLMTSVTLFGRILWSLSIFLVIPFIGLLRDIRRSVYKRKLLLNIILGLTIMLLVTGWALSIGGYYPLGRILVVASLDGFFLFIILFVAIYAFVDFVVILGDLYNRRSISSKIRPEVIFQKLLPLATFLATVFWFAAFLRNINAYKFFVARINEFINTPTIVGGYSFNFGSLLIFVLVLYFAFYLSGLLTDLFFDDERVSESTNRNRLGSYILLLRLFIISAGFVIAMLASGIPLSNASLIIGAFGVGIGFGLQHIISNLVSGIIIAFEKPIYVGDIVELGGVKGKVTDIGLRATRVDSTDGAEFIIPNGDLISKVMKNWTLSSKNFRIEFIIQVGLENDIQLVTDTMNAVLDNTPNVQRHPLPKVILNDIKTNALEFQVTCWVSDIAISANVRNALLVSMHTALREAGVKYPQLTRTEQ